MQRTHLLPRGGTDPAPIAIQLVKLHKHPSRPVLEATALLLLYSFHLDRRILNPSKLLIVQTHAGEQK